MKKLIVLFWLFVIGSILFVWNVSGADDDAYKSKWDGNALKIMDGLQHTWVQDTMMDDVLEKGEDEWLWWALDKLNLSIWPYFAWAAYIWLWIALVLIVWNWFEIVMHLWDQAKIWAAKKKIINIALWVFVLVWSYAILKLFVSIMAEIF